MGLQRAAAQVLVKVRVRALTLILTLTLTLTRCMLFLLIWGEAANLRHTPECLCYIFYCASNALLLTHPDFLERGQGEALPTADSPGPLARLPASPGRSPSAGAGEDAGGAAGEEEFLRGIVCPLYTFLKREVLVRKEDPVSTRSLYDDVNEAFWDRRRVHALLPGGVDSEESVLAAYLHL